MILALFAAATVGAALAGVDGQMSCHDAHAMISAMNASRPAGAPPVSIQLACQDGKAVRVSPVVATPPTERTPNLYQQPAHCGEVLQGEMARQKVALKGLVPMGQYAVDRTLDGCHVPTPVGYHPSAAPETPAAESKRGDAPSNRR